MHWFLPAIVSESGVIAEVAVSHRRGTRPSNYGCAPSGVLTC
jgi:hypothetical protein